MATDWPAYARLSTVATAGQSVASYTTSRDTTHLRLERVRLFGFRAAFGRRQRSECARISLAAPIAQGGRIDAFAAQDRTDPASLGGSVGFGEHACLVPGRECSPARAGR